MLLCTVCTFLNSLTMESSSFATFMQLGVTQSTCEKPSNTCVILCSQSCFQTKVNRPAFKINVWNHNVNMWNRCLFFCLSSHLNKSFDLSFQKWARSLIDPTWHFVALLTVCAAKTMFTRISSFVCDAGRLYVPSYHYYVMCLLHTLYSMVTWNKIHHVAACLCLHWHVSF